MNKASEHTVSSDLTLSGRVALVTGAAGGIGAAIATALAQQGCHVVLTDCNSEKVKMTAVSIRERGGDADFYTLDVSREDDWQRVVHSIRKLQGKLHILVNNAGIFHSATLAGTPIEDWRRVTQVNQESLYYGCKLSLPLMSSSCRLGPSGSVINLSSVAGLVGVPYCAAYAASKGAARMFSKSLAIEYAHSGYNIRVNSLHPGLIDTDMGRESLDSVKLSSSSSGRSPTGIPLGRLGRAHEIAAAALFLASDSASYITGSELVVDGGLTAQ